MAQHSPPSALREQDYEAIEEAVMETARGRWFLAEFARRNRSADTGVLLDAIGKLEGLMQRERKTPKLERIQLDLADMYEAIVRTKREIAQIKNDHPDGDRFAEASNELDAIVTQTEGATQNILNRAEQIQELAWTLREQGIDDAVCDDIDAHTTEIYMACSFQDLTGQRTQKVVQVLRYLESRINEMMNIWDIEAGDIASAAPGPINPDDHRPDAHLLTGPQAQDKAIKQDDVDALLAADTAKAAHMADRAAPVAATKNTMSAAVQPGVQGEVPDMGSAVEMLGSDAVSDNGEIDLDAISFDKIDDHRTDEPLHEMATQADEPQADEEGADEFGNAGKVLEDMLNSAADDEFVAEVDDGEEAAADASFLAMDARSTDEDDATDPLSALSAGERLALFN